MATKQNSVVEHSTTGISGYDAVAYFTEGKPRRGNGHYAAQFDGVTYLFASEDNKKNSKGTPRNTSRPTAVTAPLALRGEKNSLRIPKRGKSSMGNSI